MDGRDWGFVAVVVALSLFLSWFFLFFQFGQIHGSSMYPSLKEGDFIALRSEGVISVRQGDVIGYSPDPLTPSIAHRVVEVYPGLGYVLVKGDNAATNPWVDPYPVFASRIVGKVICRFRFPFLG